MALELGQEPLDRDGHELGSAEGGHVAEDVGGVESLPGDVEVEGVDEFRGDLFEDACGEVVVAEELLIAFEGASAECGAGFEVQGVLDVGSEDVGFDGLLSVPVEEVGEEDEAGHGIEFFGGSAEGFAEVLGEVIDGHDLKETWRKTPCQPLPMIFRPAGGMTPSKGSKRRFCRGSTEWIMAGATPFPRYG